MEAPLWFWHLVGGSSGGELVFLGLGEWVAGFGPVIWAIGAVLRARHVPVD